jgi:Metal binding domain of Ada
MRHLGRALSSDALMRAQMLHHKLSRRAEFGWALGWRPASLDRTSPLGTLNMPTTSPIETAPRWDAVFARNAGFDGKFVYAVKTTGVFCRPSCASRRAKPQNVVFYASGDEAAQAGFRACKRCRPA